MKCIVRGCENHTHQGAFVGVLCAPCHEMLTTGKPGFGKTFVHRLAQRLEAEVKEARNEAAVVRRAYMHERSRAEKAGAPPEHAYSGAADRYVAGRTEKPNCTCPPDVTNWNEVCERCKGYP